MPTKANLLKRTILQEDVCHLCSKHSEDVLHALWGCEKVQEDVCHLCSKHSEDVLHVLWGCEKVHRIWQRNFGWLDSNRVAEGSFSDLVQLVQTKPKLLPLFAVMAWAVWHHRNKSRVQKYSIPLDIIAEFAEDYL